MWKRLNNLLATVSRRTLLPQTPYAQEDAEFMSDTWGAALQGPEPSSHWILRAIGVFFLLALLWSAFATVDEATVAEGKVITSSQVQVIQNLEGGIVSKILVQVGQVVQKGQVLVQLDETRFSSSFNESQAKVDGLRAKAGRLEAEAKGTPFQPSEELVRQAPALAEQERALFLSRQYELQSELGVLRQQAEQKNQELVEKRSRLGQLEQSYALAAKELAMTRPMVAQRAMSEVELLRLERETNDRKGELDATRLALPRLQASNAEVRSKIDSTIAKFRADAATELNQVRTELASNSASKVAAEDRVARTTVRAPLTGIIKQIKIATVGGVIQPGMDLMEIVPVEDSLLIEARVRPADIAFLVPGQEALVKFSAYDFSVYGGLPGRLEHVSADTITNDKGESFYQVRVRTTSNYFSKKGKGLPIIPGMLATVHIKTGQKTVLDYLLKPVIKTKELALRER